MEEKRSFKTFLVLWATQSLSSFGSSLTFFTLSLWITTTLYPLPEQKARLAGALSAISLAHAIPLLAMAPVAGVLADRHDRKRIMFLADLGNALLSAVLAALLFSNNLSLSILLVVIVLSSVLSALHGSAFDTSYVMVVPEQMLPRANGMMQTMWALAGVLSPAVAALIISLPALARQGTLGILGGSWLASLQSGAPLVISIDAVTFLVAALVLPYLHIPSPQREQASAEERPSVLSEAAAGLRYIWLRRPLLWLLLTFAMFNFLAGPIGLLAPLILRFNLAVDWAKRGFTFETAMAMYSTLASIGGLLGGVLISVWGGLKAKRVYGVLVPMVAGGLLLLALGLSPYIYLSATLALLLSSLGPIMNAHSQTIWQRQTPPEMQGRVFAVRRIIAQISWPVATALAGWAAGRFNPGHLAAVLGLLLTAFVSVQLLNKGLRRVEDKEYLESLAESTGGSLTTLG